MILLKRVEELIDKKYNSVQLPHPNRIISTWYLLIVMEDMQRHMLMRIDDISIGSIEYFFDRAKYSLKYGLNRISNECRDASIEILPQRINEFIYERAGVVFFQGKEYSAGSQICSSVHNGTVELHEENGNVELRVDEKYHQKSYALLEMMGHQPQSSISFLQVIYSILQSKDDVPFIVTKITDSVQMKGKLFHYKYNSFFAADLSTLFHQQSFLIPNDWIFSWGGRFETTLLLNALSIRCAYHFLAIHFSGVKRKISGGGCDSLILVIAVEQLQRDLESLSSLSTDVIKKFINELTYGNGVKSPDPALQPLIPLGNNKVGLAPLHILSCNMERNLLALQTRTQKKQFDAMSSSFEENMVTRIVGVLSSRWREIRSNFTFSVDGVKEEMDLLIADPTCHTLLIGELRWTIQPSEPREVQERKKVCFEKEIQLARKIAWLQLNAKRAVMDIFGIEMGAGISWKVIGVVVVDGFGGVQSQNFDFPIMPSKIFESAMPLISSLEVFGKWSKSLDWLPQENIYYETKEQEIELEVVKIKYMGVEAIQDNSQYYDFVLSTIDEYNNKNNSVT